MTFRTFLDGRVTLYPGDCRTVLVALPEASIDSVVCDPPYHLTSIVKRFGGENAAPAKSNGATGVYKRASSGFMGKVWDGGDVAFQVETWAAVFRVLKPGAHLIAFSGTRTYHRMVCAIEDAGFEVRDQIGWTFGAGFPKSHDVSKAIDRRAGAEREVVGARDLKKPNGQKLGQVLSDRSAASAGCFGPNSVNDYPITAPATEAAKQWEGWGTALKPAWEPLVLARKPLIGTIAENVLKHGTGALNIDGCRVASSDENPSIARRKGSVNHLSDRPARETEAEGRIASRTSPERFQETRPSEQLGRWPANLCHDGSEEVLAAFPETGVSSGGKGEASQKTALAGHVYGEYSGATLGQNAGGLGDAGSAARFFYSAKADSEDRLGSKHPTVKPLDLMQWLVRLVTPRGGTCLDPFAGTGTTGEAAWREGMRAILIEREEEYLADIERRMELAANPTKRAAVAKTKNKLDDPNDLPLFRMEAAE